MSDFLERNKKKGSLAALLLLFKRGKGIGPLLLLVGMLSFVFIAPQNVLMSIPFLDSIASALGLSSFLGGGKNMAHGSLEEALEAARRRGDGLATPGSLFGKNGAGGLYGQSTVDLVKGKGEGEGEAKTYDGVGGESGKSVDGVLRPDDSKKLEAGVALNNDELVNGLMNPANAEGIGGLGAGANKAAFDNLRGYGKDSGSAMVSGGRPFGGSGDLVAQSLRANTAVPNVGGARPRGAAGGKLSDRAFRRMNAQVSGALGNARGAGRSTAMYQLAEGRAYSVASAPPPGKCDPNGCPGEYAKNIAGTVFDGSKTKGGILTASEMGEPTTPNIPSDTGIAGDIAEAEKLEEDAIACETANKTYGPQMDQSSARIQQLSDRLNSMNCNSGGCSKSKAKRCQAVGDQMRAECANSNRISQEWANACPLTNGQFSRMNCNQ